MDYKKKVILRHLIAIVMAILLFILGIFRPLLRSGGNTCLTLSIFVTIRLIRILKDEQHFEKYKKSQPDEREQFIEWKSGNTAFWVTFFANYIAMCIFGCLNIEQYMDICIYIAGFQLVVWIISWLIYRKKY